jgi:hypothetical protein
MAGRELAPRMPAENFGLAIERCMTLFRVDQSEGAGVKRVDTHSA